MGTGFFTCAQPKLQERNINSTIIGSIMVEIVFIVQTSIENVLQISPRVSTQPLGQRTAAQNLYGLVAARLCLYKQRLLKVRLDCIPVRARVQASRAVEDRAHRPAGTPPRGSDAEDGGTAFRARSTPCSTPRGGATVTARAAPGCCLGNCAPAGCWRAGLLYELLIVASPLRTCR